jgi:hypothetical protein
MYAKALAGVFKAVIKRVGQKDKEKSKPAL